MNTPDYSHDLFPFGTWPVRTAEFYDADETLVDPENLSVTVVAPDETEQIYTYDPLEDDGFITKVNEGIFSVQPQPDQPGIWFLIWSNENGLVKEDIFEIDISPLMEGGL